ncbi:MAG TPA: cation diffusion facilitator family transporter, partial [Armatimonadota bacterium]|nr:cation diffusion facilitator family transporter [Armatimonadota bacterium]
PSGDWRRLATVLALTAGFMVVEALAGFWTGSLALLADAGHMLTDVAALALALFALWFSRRAAPSCLTFGYLRFEILAALVNSIALLGITGYIFVEAWDRLSNPAPIQSSQMLGVAIVGLAVNLVSLRILSHGGGHSLNERGALLHVLGDALGSVGAIAAAVLIGAYGWQWADAVASALIGLLILRSTWELLREALNVLMEGTPVHLSVREVHDVMLAVPGVREVKDLHVWSLASGFDALSAHVVVPETESSDCARAELKAVLRERFHIEHTTLEVERPGESPECPPGMPGRCGAWQGTGALSNRN